MGPNVAVVSGGFEAFKLRGIEWAWLGFAVACAAVSIATAFVLMRKVLAADQGTTSMREIARAIQEGAVAYLRRQYMTIGFIVVPVAALVFATATKVVNPVTGHTVLGFVPSGLFRMAAFVVGATFSGLAGFIGMSTAVRGNVRTAAAARGGSLPAALRVAIRTGGVTGLFVVGFGLLGATVIVMLAQHSATAILVGFGFGGSLLALFMRVGGGIYTKAADVGGDLVGKVEAGIPEDDPRNAATIADNVGDNVGDCAGMAADLFESYGVILVASLILGNFGLSSLLPASAPSSQRLLDQGLGITFPLIVMGIGILASIVGVFQIRATSRDRSAMAPINRGFMLAAALTILGTFFVAEFYVHELKIFWAVLAGVLLGQLISRITEYYTSTETSPVGEIAQSTRTGPATTILSGVGVGLESSVAAILAIIISIAVAVGLGSGNVEFSLYLVSLIGIGLLSTTGIVVSQDTYGPVSDNAAGIAEMSGEFEGEPQRIMVSLDAVGNTTKAITKGVAIGSAVIAAVALFAAFMQTVGEQLGLSNIGNSLFNNFRAEINIAEPKVFIGLLIGGSIAFLASSFLIRAVGRSAGTVVEEVRRQFREHPGIMDRTERPDYARVVDICTRASLRELATPALIAVLTPVLVGFAIGYLALGAFLAAAILTAQLMANFLSNTGGAWDNAKKFIEEGHYGGKGSDAHKAAVIGDTVGDPFKDTAGPALNPLMKVMNLVSLLVLPAVITLQHNNAARYGIAAGAFVVIAGGIAFSKRRVEGVSAPAAGQAIAAPLAGEVATAPLGASAAGSVDSKAVVAAPAHARPAAPAAGSAPARAAGSPAQPEHS
jgi:K(+)-stimulated pyrophosphate-energized sodium pump